MNSKINRPTVSMSFVLFGCLFGPLHPSASRFAAAAELAPMGLGVSEETLKSMGEKAKTHLAKMLADKKNERRYHLIVKRLGAEGGANSDGAVAKLLMEAVEESATREGVVEPGVIEGMSDALRLIGQRGGTDGLEFLLKWAQGTSVLDRVHCRDSKGSVERTRYQLREAAVTGLGLSGSPVAHAELLRLQEAPGQVMFPKSFAGAVRAAIEANNQIASEGLEAYREKQRARFRHAPRRKNR